MNLELKLRIRTGVIMAIAVILLLFFASEPVFKTAFVLVFAVAAWEWTGFARITKNAYKIAYVLLVVAAIVASWWLPASQVLPILYLCVGFWVLALFAMPFFPKYTSWFFAFRPLVLASGVLVLVGAWVALTQIFNLEGSSRIPLLLFLMYIWLADIGAYFAGRKFGQHKLAPNVSPGKTWEGFFGGLLLVLVFGVSVALFSGEFSGKFVVMLIAVVVFSVVGDLTESCYKRTAGMKDSGTILPGHGGILDRIDSMLAAAPIYCAAYLLV